MEIDNIDAHISRILSVNSCIMAGEQSLECVFGFNVNGKLYCWK